MKSQMRMEFEAWHGFEVNDDMDIQTTVAWDDWKKAWRAATKVERDRICAAIKAEDDHCADGDYMLDSDDCIAVARGKWKRPDYGTTETPNA